MRRTCGIAIALLLIAAAACSRAPEPRRYEVRGQIIGVDPERQEVVVNHEDIPGFMPAMTMPYKVQDPALLQGKQPGDLVTATLVVEEVNAYLSTLTTTGRAPLDAAAAGPAITASDLVDEGEVVPDHALVDQTGAPRPISVAARPPRRADVHLHALPAAGFLSADGQAVHGRAAGHQQDARTRRRAAGVRDARSRVRHARRAEAAREDAGRRHRGLAFRHRRAGTTCSPSPSASASLPSLAIPARRVVHNLRTAVIDSEGRLVKVYSGTRWTPAELVADLKAAPAPARLTAVAAARAAVHARRSAAVVARLRTPDAVQRWLNALPYNNEKRRRDAAHVPRRRAHRHRALSRSGAGGRGHPRAAPLSAARPELRVDRPAGSRDLRLPRRSRAGDRSRARAIPGLHGRKPVFATPRALALSYLDGVHRLHRAHQGVRGRRSARARGIRLAAGGGQCLEGGAAAARLAAPPDRVIRSARRPVAPALSRIPRGARLQAVEVLPRPRAMDGRCRPNSGTGDDAIDGLTNLRIDGFQLVEFVDS